MSHATATPAPPATGHTKQYVFVDEYNRHKRLKVMRACDGCRKRKIRCDGALQNGPWPCGACVRLKLKCVPPTLDQDDDQQTASSTAGTQQFSFQNTTFPATGPIDTKRRSQNVLTAQPQMVHEWANGVPPSLDPPPPASTPGLRHDLDYLQSFDRTPSSRSDATQPVNAYFTSDAAQSDYDSRGHPAFIRSQTVGSSSSGGDPQDVDATVRELSHQMGDLQIDVTSAAPYITNQQQISADAPAMEEAEVVLPASVLADPVARIPPEMMPSEERAMDYFGYFFEHIHPYVPVLNKGAFLDQWRVARNTISPLLLEGIFASVARYLEEQVESRRWLALASRHEERFKDVPRLSTIQAMLILMKARESISKRGYYYRSWMDTKYMITMGLDLGLHDHREQHRMGNACKLRKPDCMMRTRIWQALFTLEILVGAPQGRLDYSIELDTVDVDMPIPSGDVNSFELQASRQSTVMAQSVRNIKLSNVLWQANRRHRKDWALDPAFVRHNEDLPAWLKQLPPDFQIHFPEDGSPPWLGGDHYVADVNCYHHLVVIMHHRPQLQALLDKGDPDFKGQLDICLDAAVRMCRIQEALYRDFGFHGLHFMIRGVNYTIYCVLTCTMLHLAAITSPDPVLNSQARQYFARHMRVLEHCLPSSTPEMQVQINALREAFSADTSLPFELKATLGLRSPVMENQSTPSSTYSNQGNAAPFHTPGWASTTDAASSKTSMAPSEYGTFNNMPGQPIQSRPGMPFHTNSFEMSTAPSYPPHIVTQLPQSQQIGFALEPVVSNEQHTPVWDPSGIFQQWNTAFGGAPPPQATPPAPRSMQTTLAPMMQNQLSPTGAQAAYGTQQIPTMAASTPPAMPVVTPLMWQDAFTSAFVSGHGQKRYREASIDHSAYAQYPSASKRRG
ncbi:C6 finger domain-containing protein [Zymoseptoria brevis]|uniref:C6 finger domain-containing protein n=1 Tax=Zymoseptoria brevis TaxID=1047168 RepID=A0A0F4GFD1_9PEZI|nr:C6 finger domain-containing protein [Zymoseptoria brevis]